MSSNTSTAPLRILKFGGSSLADAEAIRQAASVVADRTRQARVVVVVSAMAGVTDTLLDVADAAATDGGWQQTIDQLHHQHATVARALAAEAQLESVQAALERVTSELRNLLHGISLVRECSGRTRDAVAGCGERMSAPIVAAALRAAGIEAQALDSRELIVSDDHFGAARVDVDTSSSRIRTALGNRAVTPVVTGFLAATPAGATTTLGRGGSDYTAALLGAALAADAVELWTDVSGVMSADPRLVAEAFPLQSISYDELAELSHFGAKVVFPPTVHPARSAGVPLEIRNTFHPEAPGTLVTDDRPEAYENGPVRGISSIERVALLRLEGDGMVGVPGIAARLFSALARAEVNVILISQSSSEHSICFAVDPGDVEVARTAITTEFTLEEHAGLVNPLIVEEDLSIVAVVGEAMARTPGLAGRVFGVLGAHGVNVVAIAQGSSERNISLVVRTDAAAPAVRGIHRAFFTPRQPVSAVVVVGTGRVGAAVLDELQRLPEAPRVIGIARSSGAWLEPEGLQTGSWRERITAEPNGALDDLVACAIDHPAAARIVVDCTAGHALAAHYCELLEAGVAVVSANKVPFAGPLADYRRYFEAAATAPLRIEATVGAGLPVLCTLGDLIRTGDRVLRIEGVLSGTLAHLCDRMDAGEALSAAVRDALQLGMTEPDPRDDLAGQDVVRKLLILARTAGFDLEPEAVQAQPFLDDPKLFELDESSWWDRLAAHDAAIARRWHEARKHGNRLAYLATFANGHATVRLEEIPPEHPVASLSGTDNMVAFTTRRYPTRPLVIRGPGAGPEVTAAGVLADILHAQGMLRGR